MILVDLREGRWEDMRCEQICCCCCWWRRVELWRVCHTLWQARNCSEDDSPSHCLCFWFSWIQVVCDTVHCRNLKLHRLGGCMNEATHGSERFWEHVHWIIWHGLFCSANILGISSYMQAHLHSIYSTSGRQRRFINLAIWSFAYKAILGTVKASHLFLGEHPLHSSHNLDY